MGFIYYTFPKNFRSAGFGGRKSVRIMIGASNGSWTMSSISLVVSYAMSVSLDKGLSAQGGSVCSLLIEFCINFASVF